jgi:hypothetical protein
MPSTMSENLVELTIDENVVELSVTENVVEVDVSEYVVEISSPGPQGPRGYLRETAPFTYMGTLSIYTGLGRWVFTDPGIITSVQLSVQTEPLGSDVVVDVNLNGVTMFPVQSTRPKIVAGQHSSAAAYVSVPVVPGDYVTVDIDAVGSTYAGGTLVAILRTTVL